MIKVNLQEIPSTGGHNSIVEMPAVPRVGDMVFIGPDGEDAGGEVHAVLWTVGNPEYDVQVRFR